MVLTVVFLAYFLGLPYIAIELFWTYVLQKPITYIYSWISFYWRLNFTKEFHKITDSELKNIRRYMKNQKDYKKHFYKVNIKMSKLMLKKAGINPETFEREGGMKS